MTNNRLPVVSIYIDSDIEELPSPFNWIHYQSVTNNPFKEMIFRYSPESGWQHLEDKRWRNCYNPHETFTCKFEKVEAEYLHTKESLEYFNRKKGEKSS